MSFLNGTAEAAAAWASGALGTPETFMIGDIAVSACEQMSAPTELNITRKVVGTGYPITDAAVKIPRDITLVIVFVDPQLSADAIKDALFSGDPSSLIEGWRDKKDALVDYQNNRELITLTSHVEVVEDMIVQLIDPVYDARENWDGFFATVVLSQIRLQSTDEGGFFDSDPEDLGDL